MTSWRSRQYSKAWEKEIQWKRSPQRISMEFAALKLVKLHGGQLQYRCLLNDVTLDAISKVSALSWSLKNAKRLALERMLGGCCYLWIFVCEGVHGHCCYRFSKNDFQNQRSKQKAIDTLQHSADLSSDGEKCDCNLFQLRIRVAQNQLLECLDLKSLLFSLVTITLPTSSTNRLRSGEWRLR